MTRLCTMWWGKAAGRGGWYGIKPHVAWNKAAYIAGGAVLAAGAVGGAVLAQRNKAKSEN